MLTNLKTVFITGTDTSVGKSIFTAFLALSYLEKGKTVAISKPIQTGSPKDTDFLKNLTGNNIPIFNTYSFDLPAAPSVASTHEGKTIEIKKIISDIRELENKFDVVLVEGIGGIAVPITQHVIARSVSDEAISKTLGRLPRRDFVPPRNDVNSYLVSDLIKDLNYPVIIVSRPTLGTINHTVLTIELAKQKSLQILGFVISGYDEKTNDPVVKTAPDEISKITGINCLFKIPYLNDLNYDSLVTSGEVSSSKTPNVRANAYPVNL